MTVPAVILACAVLFGAACGTSSARDGLHLTVSGAGKQANKVCNADLQPLTKLEANVGSVSMTVGQEVQLDKQAASTTGRIDASLSKLGAPASYQKKLDALVVDNAKTAAAEHKLAAAYSGQPAQKHMNLNSAEFQHYYGPVLNSEGAASLLAANDDLPGLCAVGI